MKKIREPKTVNEIFAENLASSGYTEVDELKNILNKLTAEDIEKLSYAAYRACEKVGEDAFECNCLPDEEDYYENIVKKVE